MTAAINLPRILRIGAGASQQLADTLVQLGLARPLLVTDPFMLQCGYAPRLQDQLDAAGLPCEVFSDCVPDPTMTDSAPNRRDLKARVTYDRAPQVVAVQSTLPRPLP